jgi:hypothetical protein
MLTKIAHQLRQLGDIHRDPPRLGQRHLASELLQMRGHNRPSQGLWPLCRIELDLESDGDGG